MLVRPPNCLAGDHPGGSIPGGAAGVNLDLLCPHPIWSSISLLLSPQSTGGSWTPPAPSPRLGSERLCRCLLFKDSQETTVSAS